MSHCSFKLHQVFCHGTVKLAEVEKLEHLLGTQMLMMEMNRL